jgi:hypothetical protein
LPFPTGKPFCDASSSSLEGLAARRTWDLKIRAKKRLAVSGHGDFYDAPSPAYAKGAVSERPLAAQDETFTDLIRIVGFEPNAVAQAVSLRLSTKSTRIGRPP